MAASTVPSSTTVPLQIELSFLVKSNAALIATWLQGNPICIEALKMMLRIERFGTAVDGAQAFYRDVQGHVAQVGEIYPARRLSNHGKHLALFDSMGLDDEITGQTGSDQADTANRNYEKCDHQAGLTFFGSGGGLRNV